MNKQQLVQVKNLTANHVYYNIPEDEAIKILNEKKHIFFYC